MVTHNRLDYTRRTIESLKATVPEARVYIWDNASTEMGMKEYFDTLAKDNSYFIVSSEENLGMGEAVNKLIELVHKTVPKHEWVLIANNDAGYHPGWYEKLLAIYEKYPKVGIMAVWKHTAHGVLQDLGDLIVKDQMPAVGFLMKLSVIDDIGPWVVHGPCSTKGGNGEDVNYCIRAEQKGYWVAAPAEDVADHFDGY